MKIFINSVTSPLMIVTTGYLAEFHSIITAIGSCETLEEAEKIFEGKTLKHFHVVFEPGYIAVFRKYNNQHLNQLAMTVQLSEN